jgi:hypothetical protein
MKNNQRKRYTLIVLMLLWIVGAIVGGFLNEIYFPAHLIIGRVLIIVYAVVLGNVIFKLSGIKT